MTEDLQPAEVMSIVDSILSKDSDPTYSSDLIEYDVSSSEENDPHYIADSFFSYEDYSWLNTFIHHLETKATQLSITTALSETRQEILNSQHNATDFFSTVSNCRKCSNAVSAPMVFEGKRDTSKVNFVLPYYTQELSDKVKNLIADYFTEDEVSLHYLVKCRTQQYKAQDFNITNCSPYLFSELQYFKSQITVLLGKQVATHFFPNITSIEKWRGTVHYLGSYPFVISLHPQDRSLDTEHGMEKMVADLNFAKSLITYV